MNIKVGDIVYVEHLKATGFVFKLVTNRIIGIELFHYQLSPPQRYFRLAQDNLRVLS